MIGDQIGPANVGHDLGPRPTPRQASDICLFPRVRSEAETADLRECKCQSQFVWKPFGNTLHILLGIVVDLRDHSNVMLLVAAVLRVDIEHHLIFVDSKARHGQAFHNLVLLVQTRLICRHVRHPTPERRGMSRCQLGPGWP